MGAGGGGVPCKVSGVSARLPCPCLPVCSPTPHSPPASISPSASKKCSRCRWESVQMDAMTNGQLLFHLPGRQFIEVEGHGAYRWGRHSNKAYKASSDDDETRLREAVVVCQVPVPCKCLSFQPAGEACEEGGWCCSGGRWGNRRETCPGGSLRLTPLPLMPFLFLSPRGGDRREIRRRGLGKRYGIMKTH